MQPAHTKPTPGSDISGPNQPETIASPRPLLGRIAAVLAVLRTLIAYGQYFTATATTRVAEPHFATAAAVFGTYQLPVILHRMQRGILRALALQRYLLARAARGRDLRFAWPPRIDLLPHHRPPATLRAKPTAPRTAPRKEPALLDGDAPGAFHLPTGAELDREVKRRPVGRTMAYICLDLGLVPAFCDGAFWNQVEKVLRRYGGSLKRLYNVRDRREKSFRRERDRRPETWHIDWRDLRPPTVRQVLGLLIGETPPSCPGPGPVLVPS